MTVVESETALEELRLVPLDAGVSERNGRVELSVAFAWDGRGEIVTFVCVSPALGARECGAIAANVARRLNRDSAKLPPPEEG